MPSIYKIILIILLTSGCGFKVINQINSQNFSINALETEGDKKIGYLIKNKLLIKTKQNSENKININIIANKNKTIKEKNTKNEITKYLITINLDIKVEKNNKIIKEFKVSNQSDFNVSAQYSQTIVNENETITLITDSLMSKITRELTLINFNDL